MKIKNLLHILVLAILCFSCSADIENTTVTSKNKVNNIDEYIAIGKLHNDLLEVAGNVCTEAISRSEDFSFMANDSAIFRQIHAQQLAAVEKMAIGETEKSYLKASLNENISFYQTENVYKALNGSDNTRYLLTELYKLNKEGIIDLHEQTLLNSLVFYINSDYEDGDHERLKKNIDSLCKRWERLYGDKEEKAGEFSGQIIGIAKASIDWWEENTEETRALPAWVGADAAGAIVGAAVNATSQYLSTGKVHLTQVGYHALGSAVVSSTGVVKFVASWINKGLTAVIK